MICERLQQVDIRKLGRNLPNVIPISGTYVRTTSTPCHLGGHRHWFLCPSCGRRCAILYPSRCRKCVNGRYAVELMSPNDRRLQKAFNLRHQLGQKKGGVAVPFPSKPKWMRWHTYLNHRRAAMELEREIAIALCRSFPSLMRGRRRAL
jgi:hypothetical protein